MTLFEPGDAAPEFEELTVLRTAAQQPGWQDARRAAFAATQRIKAFDRTTILSHEIAGDVLDAERAAWAKLAHDTARYADVRVMAMSMVAALDELGAQGADDLPKWATDSDPEVRRAAFELMPERAVNEVWWQDAMTRGIADPLVPVASAAAMTWCTDGFSKFSTYAMAHADALQTALAAWLADESLSEGRKAQLAGCVTQVDVPMLARQMNEYLRAASHHPHKAHD